MKKGILPMAVGTAVTAAGLALDSNQNKKRHFKKNDYKNMAGALLVGAGVAHIALGGIDVIKE
ncbi:asparagine synthase [Romboutsia maritimum]|uniref:Asparagine synthase n=1 Tax=Romboutsia maritimum TaxID=2020948 RepID=A0A371IS99_9FIRM|nr:asparagine synthase [Romboutsia maritimum]RDY23351.1 asparagine synthase [Romboutsia maritimum]